MAFDALYKCIQRRKPICKTVTSWGSIEVSDDGHKTDEVTFFLSIISTFFILQHTEPLTK